jgi:hypothetical protein
MEMGSSKVNVGTVMTGDVLFTSISNALTSMCPTPTSAGAWTSCETGTIIVGQATYLEGQGPEGDLTIHVTDAQYNSTDYLNLFIHMIAGAANATATGSNCKSLEWRNVSYAWERDIDGREVDPDAPIEHSGTSIFCNINNFLDAQWYDGVQESALMWFETEVRQPLNLSLEGEVKLSLCFWQFGFELGELGNFDCSSTVALVGEVLGASFEAIFPEFAWLIETGVQLGEFACEAAETFNPTKSRREIEMDQADRETRKSLGERDERG